MADDDFDTSALTFFCEDAVKLFLDDKAAAPEAAREFLLQYFEAVVSGMHVRTRGIEYCGHTVWNRLALCHGAGAAFPVEVAPGEVVYQFTTLLCPDFPIELFRVALAVMQVESPSTDSVSGSGSGSGSGSDSDSGSEDEREEEKEVDAGSGTGAGTGEDTAPASVKPQLDPMLKQVAADTLMSAVFTLFIFHDVLSDLVSWVTSTSDGSDCPSDPLHPSDPAVRPRLLALASQLQSPGVVETEVSPDTMARFCSKRAGLFSAAYNCLESSVEDLMTAVSHSEPASLRDVLRAFQGVVPLRRWTNALFSPSSTTSVK